jgi:polysaccharide biosynthesis/export protein ExoF
MSKKVLIPSRFQTATAGHLFGLAVASTILIASSLSPTVSAAGQADPQNGAFAATHADGVVAADDRQGPAAIELKASNSPAPPTVKSSDELLIGDKIQISFFEQLDLGQGADAGMTADVRTFYQRLDLTGEHIVDAEGSVNIPLLGRFMFAGLTADEARLSIMDAYKRLMGKTGEVNIAIIERKSVFVTGIVKSSGAFKYEPGMIAVQAIALAGGYDRDAGAAQRMIDVQRERERLLMSQNRLDSLEAKRIRLMQQRDLRESKVDELPQGETKLDPVSTSSAMQGELRLLDAEISAKSGAVSLEESRLSGAKSQIESLKVLAEMVAKQVVPRTERLMILQKMQGRGISTLEVLWNAQKEVADLQMQHQRLNAEIDQAEQNVSAAKFESANAKSSKLLDIERELVSVEEEIRQQKQIAAASEAMMSSLQRASSGAKIGQPLRLKIMRRSSTGTTVLEADETSDLRPGDVVKVEVVPEGEAASLTETDSL